MTWARRVTDSIADGASDGTDADKLVDTLLALYGAYRAIDA